MVMTIALLFAVYLNYDHAENVFLVIASWPPSPRSVGVDYDPAVTDSLPPPSVARRGYKALKFKVPWRVLTTVIGLLFPPLLSPYRLSSGHPHLAVRRYGVDCAVAARLVFKTRRERRLAQAQYRHRPGQHRAAGAACGPASSPVILPKSSEMMSSAPGGYGKVCPFCTMRIHDVEGMAPSGLHPFIKVQQDRLFITLWLSGESLPQRITLRAEG